METLSAHRALQLATNAVPILKHLAAANRTMTYMEFGQALGIVHHVWKPWHQEQLALVFRVMRSAFDHVDGPQLEYHRIVYKRSVVLGRNARLLQRKEESRRKQMGAHQ